MPVFFMLDVLNRGVLSKASILKAIHDDHRVADLLHSSKSLRPLLTPKNYEAQFQKMNTSKSGLVSMEEFEETLESWESAAANGTDERFQESTQADVVMPPAAAEIRETTKRC